MRSSRSPRAGRSRPRLRAQPRESYVTIRGARMFDGRETRVVSPGWSSSWTADPGERDGASIPPGAETIDSATRRSCGLHAGRPAVTTMEMDDDTAARPRRPRRSPSPSWPSSHGSTPARAYAGDSPRAATGRLERLPSTWAQERIRNGAGRRPAHDSWRMHAIGATAGIATDEAASRRRLRRETGIEGRRRERRRRDARRAVRHIST